MTPFEVSVLCLAAWRLAYMLVHEGGPYGLLLWVRRRMPSQVLECLYCTSVWTGGGMLLLWHAGFSPLVWVLAISAGAILIQRALD